VHGIFISASGSTHQQHVLREANDESCGALRALRYIDLTMLFANRKSGINARLNVRRAVACRTALAAVAGSLANKPGIPANTLFGGGSGG
jgi:hypothetical protein